MKVVIIGGGLAGLAAAATAARAGAEVVLCERARALGGRAGSKSDQGYIWNLGPHALYRKGPGVAVLRALGVPVVGRAPPFGGQVWLEGALHPLPVGAGIWGSYLGAGGLASLGLGLGRAMWGEQREADGQSLRAWLDARVADPRARATVEALARVATYSASPEQMSAGAALRQLQSALTGNVLYLDGGWQRLVEGLASAAEGAGATLRAGAAARAARAEGGGWAVELDDGEVLRADRLVLAVGPRTARALLGEVTPAAWERLGPPVYAACLDLALSRLPAPGNNFAVGIDQPLYASVHSVTAALAPPGGAVVHLARYGGVPDGRTGDEVQAELEALMDALQPGWREAVVARRFLPRLVVAEALDTADNAGWRPDVRVSERPGLLLAGDWVGAEGMIADAALASGARAGALAAVAGGAVGALRAAA